MSSDNPSSAVTYTSVSSDSNGPSWGIPLVNSGELSEMDPYEEIAQQGQVPPLSPAYVLDPMELDEHVPVYVLKPEHPEYHASSDDDIQEDTNKDSIDYPDEPKDDDEDPEEDPNKEHKPEDEDTKEKEPSEGSDETELFEEDKTAVTPPPPRHRGARISIRPKIPMATSTHALIDAFVAGSSPFPLPPTSSAYDQAPLGHRVAMISMRDDIPEEDMPPRRRFVLTAPPPGCDVAESSGTRAHRKDVGYVRALQAFERRMMTSIEEVNLRVSYQAQVHRQESADFYTQLLDAQTDRRDIRLEIDVVRGERTTYETKPQERQSAEVLVVTQMMLIHALEARARTDTMEDPDSSCYRIMPATRQGTSNNMTPEAVQAMIDQAILRNSTNSDGSHSFEGGPTRPVQPVRAYSYSDFMKCQPFNFRGTKGVVGLSRWVEKMESVFHISGCVVENQNLKVRGNDVAVYTQRFQELALMCTKFYADETAKINKYIGGLPDNIHGNVMSTRPKTLDFAIELANDLMDQKLRTYAVRQNENKRKADDSSRNNQQQPHKKQNVARAYTAGPGENKVYTWDLPLCTK
nr:hypothetical protein [Tanacetum cinerariifolium]